MRISSLLWDGNVVLGEEMRIAVFGTMWNEEVDGSYCRYDYHTTSKGVCISDLSWYRFFAEYGAHHGRYASGSGGRQKRAGGGAGNSGWLRQEIGGSDGTGQGTVSGKGGLLTLCCSRQHIFVIDCNVVWGIR